MKAFLSRQPSNAAWRRWLLSCLLLLAGGMAAAQAGELLAASASPKPAARELAVLSYSGSSRCAACHQAQGDGWRQSHHAQSMQVAEDKTVLGDFRQVTLDHHGQRVRFFRQGGKFMVRVEDVDGSVHELPIAYTFGVHPLQQYLVALPGGRLQALGWAWDARRREEGGQRWYPLYPDNPPPPGDPAHWRGRDQNWNFMCAACHSTGVRKNYDAHQDRYRTTWAALNVACESCHGPGSRHVAWAEGKPRGKALANFGLVAETLRRTPFTFTAPDQAIARPAAGDAPALSRSKTATEACLGCHSRRQELLSDHEKDGSEVAKPYLDRYLPSLVESGLYHADGQVDGEVFEGVSFLQSAMARAGVSCRHCHDSHSLKLRATGNALCAQCHLPQRYDAVAHHRHTVGSEGGQCINCHMPSKTFMGVHVRRDHSLRIPDPTLSRTLGSPDACTACHRDKPADWAAQALARWREEAGVGGALHAGEAAVTASATAINAAWLGSPEAERLNAALAAAVSGVGKASLLSLLPRDDSPRGAALLHQAARDADGWVRLGVARALAAQSPALAWTVGSELLGDSLRAVRIEAARSLAGLGPPTSSTDTGWTPGAALRQRWQAASEELVAVETASIERPEAQVNLATFYRRQGRLAEAEQGLMHTLRQVPTFVPALVNLADVYRQQGRDQQAEPLLRQAVNLAPKGAEPAEALGLLLIRQGRREEALPWLQKAADLAPGNPRYAYILAAARKALAKP
jgi:tetratricopeptide (TPR) repeat protein